MIWKQFCKAAYFKSSALPFLGCRSTAWSLKNGLYPFLVQVLKSKERAEGRDLENLSFNPMFTGYG